MIVARLFCANCRWYCSSKGIAAGGMFCQGREDLELRRPKWVIDAFHWKEVANMLSSSEVNRKEAGGGGRAKLIFLWRVL